MPYLKNWVCYSGFTCGRRNWLLQVVLWPGKVCFDVCHSLFNPGHIDKYKRIEMFLQDLNLLCSYSVREILQDLSNPVTRFSHGATWPPPHITILMALSLTLFSFSFVILLWCTFSAIFVISNVNIFQDSETKYLAPEQCAGFPSLFIYLYTNDTWLQISDQEYLAENIPSGLFLLDVP